MPKAGKNRIKNGSPNARPILSEESLVLRRKAERLTAAWVAELERQKDAAPVIRFTNHFAERGDERSISELDALEALAKGKLIEFHRDNEYGNRRTLWRYEVNGKAICVVLDMDEMGLDGSLPIISAYINRADNNHDNGIGHNPLYSKDRIPDWWVVGGANVKQFKASQQKG